tara:strand:- start:375 stop:1442 length:1068 start_codon:yes stop_codon:yes gene_type:complete
MGNIRPRNGNGDDDDRQEGDSREINAPVVAPEMEKRLEANLPGLGDTQRAIAEGAQSDPTYTYQAPGAATGRGVAGTGRTPETLSEYIRNVQALQNPELMATFGRQDQPMTPYDWQMVGVNEQWNQYNKNLQERSNQLATLNQQGAYQPAMTNLMAGVADMSNPFAAQRAGLREQFAGGRQRQMSNAIAQQRMQSGTGMDPMQKARLQMQMDQAQRGAESDLQAKQNEAQLAQYAEAGNIASKAQQLMNQRQGQAAQYQLGTLPEAFDFSLLSTPPTLEQRKESFAAFPWLGDTDIGSEFFQSMGFLPWSVSNLWDRSADYSAARGFQGGPGNSSGTRYNPADVIARWKVNQGFA